jgi:hypothetical protein
MTFCSDWCVYEWKPRTDAGYLREKVFERDRRLYFLGHRCVAVYAHLRRLRGAARLHPAAEWNLGGRKSLWDSDHVILVVQAGWECDLSNMRTLRFELSWRPDTRFAVVLKNATLAQHHKRRALTLPWTLSNLQGAVN